MPDRETVLVAWGVPEAARIIGVPYRTLRRWLMDGLIALTFHPRVQPQERARLTLDDLAEAWCIADLRRAGVSMQAIRRVLVRLDALQEREQRRLADFRAVIVDEQGQVVGVHDDGHLEHLRDGQICIDLARLRHALREAPGEPVPESWARLLRMQEAGFCV
jgi:DNA-binding transcriptional MerR regulator